VFLNWVKKKLRVLIQLKYILLVLVLVGLLTLNGSLIADVLAGEKAGMGVLEAEEKNIAQG
tara:strand:+ start:248 stop:430 length:183 start_codon:yes stop_codon:yes gene_type:complete